MAKVLQVNISETTGVPKVRIGKVILSRSRLEDAHAMASPGEVFSH